jgi:hypothetical protein
MFKIQAIDDFRLIMEQTQRLKNYMISGVVVSMISMVVQGFRVQRFKDSEVQGSEVQNPEPRTCEPGARVQKGFWH